MVRLRCEDLRTKISECHRKELKDVHLKQMEDKLAKQEANRERDLMYYEIMKKDCEAMVNLPFLQFKIISLITYYWIEYLFITGLLKKIFLK